MQAMELFGIFSINSGQRFLETMFKQKHKNCLGWVLILAGIVGAAVSAVRFVVVLNRKEEDKGGIKHAWKYLLFAIISICVGFAGVAILMHIGQGAQDYNV